MRVSHYALLLIQGGEYRQYHVSGDVNNLTMVKRVGQQNNNQIAMTYIMDISLINRRVYKNNGIYRLRSGLD